MTHGGNRTQAAIDAQLKIGVSNFGPISRGTLRIAPMTILVGPNNSGKTYAALLAHSVLSCMSAGADPRCLAAMMDERRKSQGFRRLVQDMESLVDSAGSDRVRIPPRLSGQVCDLVGAFFARELASTIEGNFGIGLAGLVRTGARSSKIRISGSVAASITLRKGSPPTAVLDPTATQYALAARAGQIAVYEHKPGNGIRDSRYHDSSVNDRVDLVLDKLGMAENLGLRAVLALFMTIGQPYFSRPTRSYYLPAGRSGILSTYDMLLSNIVNSTKYGERDRDARITGTMSDFVTFFHNVPAQRPPVPKNGKTAVGEMFGGRLVLSKPRFAPTRITYKLNGTEIPIRRASSGIAETAPFQLFQSGSSRADVLVFEEPEAHLHPESQTKLAKHIMRLVNDGTHAILVTHSVHFLEQMSLFLKMSRLTPGQRKQMKYAPGDFLDNDDVSTYAFKADPKGGYEIREIEHSVADGISQDEFIHTIECMYEEDLEVEQKVEL